jgi:hypothetical protein
LDIDIGADGWLVMVGLKLGTSGNELHGRNIRRIIKEHHGRNIMEGTSRQWLEQHQ